MNFEDLSVGKIVRISPRMVMLLGLQPALLGTVPEDESYSCILHIDRADNYSVCFSCCAECGKHSVEEICVYDYEQLSEKAGEDFFIPSSASEFFMSYNKNEPTNLREVYEFNLEEETENIVEMLAKEVDK